MTEKDIRPIPKYIIKMIRKADKNRTHHTPGTVRFYCYLTIWKKELIKVTVAVKERNGKWYCKQVAFHGLNSERCYVKDIEYCYIGMGYRVGWYDEGLQSYSKWYENGYCSALDKYYDPWAPIVNKEIINKIPEFKYSAYELYPYSDILKYLRIYRAFPNAEFLVKFGLHDYATKKTLLRQLNKDKAFRRWLIANKDEIKSHNYYVSTIFKAFKNKIPLATAQCEEKILKSFYADRRLQGIHKYFKEKEALKLVNYLKDKNTSYNSYSDYFSACLELELDMSLSKNRYPHDFKHWHDVRIDQYHTKKAILAEQTQKELATKFVSVAEKYLCLEHKKHKGLFCVIAHSPDELINEGEMLHHCVGKMNYDQKFAREESLIFFIRSNEEPNKPFVTVEYSLSRHIVLQCLGDHNSKPNAKTMRYINKVWLPYANKQLKQLAA